MLINAKQILVSELVLVEERDKDEVEEYVENKINASYQLHEVSHIHNIAVGQNEIPADNIVKKFVSAN